MQDIEFTIERGTLFMLQTRTGKRTGVAAVKIACDLVKEKLIDEKEAVLRVPAKRADPVVVAQFQNDCPERRRSLCKGINASPGAAVGKMAFTAEEARRDERMPAKTSFWSDGKPAQKMLTE